MNTEQEGAARGSGSQGRHVGGEGTRGHCHSAHADQVGRLRLREQERLNRVLAPSSCCLHSPLASRGSFLTFLTGSLPCALRPQSCIPPKKGDS